MGTCVLMALRRVFVDHAQGRTAAISGARAHHLARVARLQQGEEVEASDGERLFLVRVARVTRTEVAFEIERELPVPPAGPSVRLKAAIFKFARLERMIEKATELGVASIVPVASERSDKHLIEAAPRRIERWRRIAEEAALQSRHMAAPLIEPVMTFDRLAYEPGPAVKLILEPAGELLKDVLARGAGAAAAADAALLVGPEGGWTDDEVAAAHAAGYVSVSLGASILRAETAALSALSVVTHLLQAERAPVSSGESRHPGR